VNLYHDLISKIGEEIGHDLSEFAIPAAEVRHPNAGYTNDSGQGLSEQSTHAYCDAEMFRTHMHGALNFIASLLPESDNG